MCACRGLYELHVVRVRDSTPGVWPPKVTQRTTWLIHHGSEMLSPVQNASGTHIQCSCRGKKPEQKQGQDPAKRSVPTPVTRTLSQSGMRERG